MDPGTDDRAAAGKRAEGGGHELARGREDDRRVELLRGPLVRPPRPVAAELVRELARRVVAAALVFGRVAAETAATELSRRTPRRPAPAPTS